MIHDWDPAQLRSALEQGGALFLKLWKRGCGPCKLSTPAVERLQREFGEQVQFGQVCIDDHPDMLEISESEILPTFFIFKDRKMLATNIGFKGLAKLKDFLTSNLELASDS